ncbi:hypothetical protein HK101_008976 [Irineochytrium annulatum]|nr:hypothetical protein HK101_008976 [Irineochytrium annulatum]
MTAAVPAFTPTPAVTFPPQNYLYSPCDVCKQRESLCPTYDHDCPNPSDPAAIKTIHVRFNNTIAVETTGERAWGNWSVTFITFNKSQHTVPQQLAQLAIQLQAPHKVLVKFNMSVGDSYELHEQLTYLPAGSRPGALPILTYKVPGPIYYITVDDPNTPWPPFYNGTNPSSAPTNSTGPDAAAPSDTVTGWSSLWIAVVVTAAMVVVVAFGAIYIIQRMRKVDRRNRRGPKLTAEEQAAFDAAVEAAVAARVEAEFEAEFRRRIASRSESHSARPDVNVDTELGAASAAGVKQSRSMGSLSAKSPDRRNSRLSNTESYVSNGSNQLLVHTSNLRSYSAGSSGRPSLPPAAHTPNHHIYPPQPPLAATDLPPTSPHATSQTPQSPWAASQQQQSSASSSGWISASYSRQGSIRGSVHRGAGGGFAGDASSHRSSRVSDGGNNVHAGSSYGAYAGKVSASLGRRASGRSDATGAGGPPAWVLEGPMFADMESEGSQGGDGVGEGGQQGRSWSVSDQGRGTSVARSSVGYEATASLARQGSTRSKASRASVALRRALGEEVVDVPVLSGGGEDDDEEEEDDDPEAWRREGEDETELKEREEAEERRRSRRERSNADRARAALVAQEERERVERRRARHARREAEKKEAEGNGDAP